MVPWAFRQKKKTEHYDVASEVFLDAQALSGRPVQIFHSDGVFSGNQTVEILREHKIRRFRRFRIQNILEVFATRRK
jgi:hypothetical protein